MIGRVVCFLIGHRPRLIASGMAPRTRRRIETWACDRCPWATSHIVAIGAPLAGGPVPVPPGLVERIGEPAAFYLVAGVVVLAALVVAVTGRPHG